MSRRLVQLASSAVDHWATKSGLHFTTRTNWLHVHAPLAAPALHRGMAAGNAHPADPLFTPAAPTPAADVGKNLRKAQVAAPTVKHSAVQMLQMLDDLLDKAGDGQADDAKARGELVEIFTQFNGEELLLQTGALTRAHPGHRTVLASLSRHFQQLAASQSAFTVEQYSNFLSSTTLLGLHDVKLTNAIVCRCRPELSIAAPTAIAALSYALGTLGHTDVAFLHAMEEMLLRRSDDFDVQPLAKCVWMLGRVGYINDNVASVVQRLTQRALAPEATASDLVYSMWACAVHGEYNSALADRVVVAVPPHIHTLTGGELAKLAFCLVEEDVRDGDLFSLIGNAAARGDLESMFPRDVAKLVYALGKAQVADAAVLHALGLLVEQHLHRFTPNELDMIIAGYNNLGVHDNLAVLVAKEVDMRKGRGSSML